MFGISAFAATPYASLAGTAYSSAVSETGTATDAVSSIQTFLSAIAETATGTDAVSSLQTFGTAVTETGTATDAAFGRTIYLTSVTETSTATDSDVGFITFPVSISETATVTDTDSVLVVFLAFVIETATATDTLAQRLLWELIDDTQTPNWVVIGNTQTPTWTAVDTRIFINYTVNTVISSNTSVIGVVTIFPNISLTVTSGVSFTMGPANSSGNDYATDWTVIGTVN